MSNRVFVTRGVWKKTTHGFRTTFDSPLTCRAGESLQYEPMYPTHDGQSVLGWIRRKHWYQRFPVWIHVQWARRIT